MTRLKGKCSGILWKTCWFNPPIDSVHNSWRNLSVHNEWIYQPRQWKKPGRWNFILSALKLKGKEICTHLACSGLFVCRTAENIDWAGDCNMSKLNVTVYHCCEMHSLCHKGNSNRSWELSAPINFKCSRYQMYFTLNFSQEKTKSLQKFTQSRPFNMNDLCSACRHSFNSVRTIISA